MARRLYSQVHDNHVTPTCIQSGLEKQIQVLTFYKLLRAIVINSIKRSISLFLRWMVSSYQYYDLIFEAMKYFGINHGDQRTKLEIIINISFCFM